MKGIERASVMIDKQEKSGFELTPLKTASVTAWAVGGVPLDEDQVNKIRYYVAAAIAGMKPENVTITDANGHSYPGNQAEHGGGDAYARAARNAEQTLTAKVRNALAYIPNVTVTPSVELNQEKGIHSREIKNDPKAVPVRTLESNRTMSRDSAASGGAPGLQSQDGGPMAARSLGANNGKGPNETNDESRNETISAVSSVTIEKEIST